MTFHEQQSLWTLAFLCFGIFWNPGPVNSLIGPSLPRHWSNCGLAIWERDLSQHLRGAVPTDLLQCLDEAHIAMRPSKLNVFEVQSTGKYLEYLGSTTKEQFILVHHVSFSMDSSLVPPFQRTNTSCCIAMGKLGLQTLSIWMSWSHQ